MRKLPGLAVMALALGLAAAPGLAKTKHKPPPKVFAERSCQGILGEAWFKYSTTASAKVIADNRDEEASICIYGLSSDQTDPTNPAYLPPAQQMEAGGVFTLRVLTRRAWAAQRYGNILPPVALPPGGHTKLVLHHVGTRAVIYLLGEGAAIGVMQDHNVTAEITAPLLDEVTRGLRETADSF